MKCRLLLVGAWMCVGALSAQGQITADADFAARCKAAGVIECFAFDNTTTDIVKGTNLFGDGAGTVRAGLDTTQKASGAGSLRFDLPPPPHSGANIAGSWVSGPWDRTFSESSTFYVQYRLRLSRNMVVSSPYGSEAIWKTSIFHFGNRTCGSIELTTSNYYGQPLPQLDTDCGSKWMWTTPDGTTPTMNPPLLMQQTDDLKCAYGVNYSQNCQMFVPDEWMTLYYRFQVGTWDQANSQVDAWIGRQGAPLKQFIKIRNFTLSCNDSPCTVSPARDAGYNNVTLTPYMTRLDPNVGPSSTEYMWFDEFIVSTQPIAAPGVPRPNPPTGVSAN